MSDLSTIIVEGCHYRGDHLDLSGTDFWAFALEQRAYGPRQLVVVTARRDGTGTRPGPLRGNRTARAGPQVRRPKSRTSRSRHCA